tara:strand:- start:2012 stop:3022 length:1011 start_codon:yes stop_codon:yes gene_type:complete
MRFVKPWALLIALIPLLAASAEAQEAWQRAAKGRIEGRTAHLNVNLQSGEARLRIGKRNYSGLAKGEFTGAPLAFELRDEAGDMIRVQVDPKQKPLKGSFHRGEERIGYFKERKIPKARELPKLKGSVTEQIAQIRGEEEAHRARLLDSLRALDSDLDKRLEKINKRLQAKPNDPAALEDMKQATARHAALKQNLFSATYGPGGADPREESGPNSPSAHRPTALKQLSQRLRTVPAKTEAERAEVSAFRSELRARYEREGALYKKGDYQALSLELEERVVAQAPPRAAQGGVAQQGPAGANKPSARTDNGVANYLIEQKKAADRVSKSLEDALSGK